MHGLLNPGEASGSCSRPRHWLSAACHLLSATPDVMGCLAWSVGLCLLHCCRAGLQGLRQGWQGSRWQTHLQALHPPLGRNRCAPLLFEPLAPAGWGRPPAPGWRCPRAHASPCFGLLRRRVLHRPAGSPALPGLPVQLAGLNGARIPDCRCHAESSLLVVLPLPVLRVLGSGHCLVGSSLQRHWRPVHSPGFQAPPAVQEAGGRQSGRTGIKSTQSRVFTTHPHA